MDYVFNRAGKSDLTDEKDLEFETDLDTEEYQREVDEEELKSYIEYLEKLPQKYANDIVNETTTADYDWRNLSETLLSKHMNIWWIKDSEKVILFESEQAFIEFILNHEIKDVFVCKKTMDVMNYIIYKGNSDLQVDIDIQVQKACEVIINGDILYAQEEKEFKMVINKYKENIERLIDNQNKSIVAYVRFEGNAYGVKFETDDCKLYELKSEFYETIQWYIRRKGYSIEERTENIMAEAYRETEEIIKFLVTDNEFRKCTNKQLRSEYRMSGKVFENNRFPNLHYIINNVESVSKKYYRDVRMIIRAYDCAFENDRRAIRTGVI